VCCRSLSYQECVSVCHIRSVCQSVVSLECYTTDAIRQTDTHSCSTDTKRHTLLQHLRNAIRQSTYAHSCSTPVCDIHTLLQHTSYTTDCRVECAIYTHSCSTRLQHTLQHTYTHSCSTLLQHTSATHQCCTAFRRRSSSLFEPFSRAPDVCCSSVLQ